MAKVGKPRLIITSEMSEKAEQLGARGLNQEQIARCLGIGYSTLMDKKHEFPEFEEAIKKGQCKGISIVANSLFESAKSGNVTAQIFFLKCRAGWKETIVNQLEIKQEDVLKELDQ